jgi:hypothetical protein
MKKEELIEFFRSKDFRTHTSDDELDLETWTDGGVNMFIHLQPITVEEFINQVDSFDIDEEIDLHREDKRYKNDFTIRQSLDDFTAFQNRLEEIVSELTNQN